jgi:hypothetical protein
MSTRLLPLIKTFGLFDGVVFFIRRISKKDGSYYSSRYHSKIHLRNNTQTKLLLNRFF